MSTELTISELGRKVGLPPKTIRFYEEIGLIQKTRRAENRYRMYDPQIIEELRMIKYARDLGLPINEIKKLMKGCVDKSCTHTQEYLTVEISNYLNRVNQKILELETLRGKLESLNVNILSEEKECTDETAYCCNILGQLVDDETTTERR